VIAGLALVALFALIAFGLMRRPRQQAELIERIKAAGGFVTHDPPASLQERISAIRQGAEWDTGYTAVRLYTSDISDDWLHELDDLAALDITDLTLAETALPDADLAQMIRRHPLQVVELRREDVGDQTVAALADTPGLFLLTIRESPLSDAQFARLPLETLEELRIDDTLVTSAGLRELRRSGKLVVLTLDGRQFDDDTARTLGGLATLRAIELVGNEVSDEHVARLHRMTALESITFQRSAVTQEAVDVLKTTLPNCDVRVR
jgi:hypothetical protein